MPHSRPTDITNRGDAWRLTHAAGAFVRELGTDIRVKALYTLWRESREGDAHALKLVEVANGTIASYKVRVGRPKWTWRSESSFRSQKGTNRPATLDAIIPRFLFCLVFLLRRPRRGRRRRVAA